MKKIECALTRGLRFVLAMCLLFMAAVVVTLVVLRYVFNASITGANELLTIMFVYTTALGAAVAVGRREHIAIAFAVEWLPDRGQRVAGVVELVLVAILNAVMVGYSVGWMRLTGAYLMPATGLPRMVVQASIPLGCGLALVYCILRLISPAVATHDGPGSTAADRPVSECLAE